MNTIIREPLVHFLLLGAALFGVYLLINRGKAPPPDQIVLTSGQIENLMTGFTKVWRRPPTQAELKGLIDNDIKEEILSREAIKLGLDQNDLVIRHRLDQKMEFIAEDLAAASEPTDIELADYLAKHPDKFRQDERFTFRQVFLNREKRGDQIDADAAALLATLRQHPSADISDLGDPLILPQALTDELQRTIAAQFGPEFAAGLANVTTGQWSGPLQSGYGVHLVLITRRIEGRLPALADVRDQVKAELINARRAEASARFFEALLARYHVEIQPPSDKNAPASAGVAMKP